MREMAVGSLVQSQGPSQRESPVDERRPETVLDDGRVDEEDAVGKEREDKRRYDPSDHVPKSLAVGVVQPPCAHAVVNCILGATCEARNAKQSNTNQLTA